MSLWKLAKLETVQSETRRQKKKKNSQCEKKLFLAREEVVRQKKLAFQRGLDSGGGGGAGLLNIAEFWGKWGESEVLELPRGESGEKQGNFGGNFW